MTSVGVVFRPQLPPDALRGVVEAAEVAGVDELWLWEDCFLEGGLTTSAAALAWSDRLQVGIGLLPVPLRNPAVTAMEIASLARMFPGRFWPGLGHGVQSWMGQVGGRADSPLTLLREHVAAVRSLLAGDTVTVHGRYVRLDAVTLDWPPDVVPPVLVGARGPRTVVASGEVGDGTILDASATVGDIGHVRAAVDAARVRVGRPGRHRLVVFQEVPSAEQTPATVAEIVARCAAAGSDAVALQGPEDDPDPARLVAALGRR